MKNTLIIDHNVKRVAYNRGGNVIVTKPFYVLDLKNLGDDRMHLKRCVWPLLEKFYGSRNVPHYRKKLHGVLAKAGITAHSDQNTYEPEVELCCHLEGEGTSEPTSSFLMLSPHLALKSISNSGCGSV